MPIIEPAIRPPSEANSFLLQVTLGCSAGSCTFCGSYHGKKFKLKSTDEILQDIKKGSVIYPDARKSFLMDGDALVINNNKLIPILKQINLYFPKINRISSYANDFNILNRTDNELKELYDHKLRLIYMGLESGSQKILDKCCKKSTVNGMINAIQKCHEFKIRTSIIVLLGLGGRDLSKDHVEQTAIAVNKMQPTYLSFLALMILPHTHLFLDMQSGNFIPLDQYEILWEMHEIIKRLELNRTVFFANHASNYLPITGRFPHDKKDLLNEIKDAMNGKTNLMPEFLRGL